MHMHEQAAELLGKLELAGCCTVQKKKASIPEFRDKCTAESLLLFSLLPLQMSQREDPHLALSFALTDSAVL